MIATALRQRIRTHQIEEDVLATIYRNVYECQAHLVRECFYDALSGNHDSDDEEPLVSLEIYQENWRGKYQTTGPLGLTDVITINFNGRGMNKAEDLLRTLAHELGHWAVRKSPGARGHSQDWRDVMQLRAGLVFSDRGQWQRDVGLWWEISSELELQTQAIDEWIAALGTHSHD